MKSFFKKIKNSLNNLVSLNKINPHADWRKLIFIFFVVSVLLILFSLFLLYQIKNQQVFQEIGSSPEAPMLIDEKLLNKIEESFEQKSIIEKEIKNNLKSYKDPSI